MCIYVYTYIDILYVCVCPCPCVCMCVQLWSLGGKQHGLLYIFKKAVREAPPTIMASAGVNY